MEFKRQAKKSPATPPSPAAPVLTQPPTQSKDAQIHISINLGRFAKLTRPSVPTLHQLTHNKRAIIVAAIVLLLVGSGATYYVLHRSTATQEAKPPTLSKLAYQTLTPQGKPTTQLGGWHRVSPPESAPVYAYVDTIDKVSITVSQQPLPDQFIEGTDAQLAELAKSFGATNEIKADGVKVYVGTSSKGPQSAILIKNGLLILIKSQSKISDEAWARYAESLK